MDCLSPSQCFSSESFTLEYDGADVVLYMRLQILYDRLRDMVRGIQPCPLLRDDGPEVNLDYLHQGRQQLQVWFQHLRLYPAVKDAVAFRSFILDQANLVPAHLEVLWTAGTTTKSTSSGRGLNGFGGAGTPRGGKGGIEEDDMDMDELFQGRHSEQDVAAQEEETGLPFAAEEDNLEDDEEDPDGTMETFEKHAAGAETVFYNPEMDEDGETEGGNRGSEAMWLSHDEPLGREGASGVLHHQPHAGRLMVSKEGKGMRMERGLGMGGGLPRTPRKSNGLACDGCKKRASLDSFKIVKVIGKGSFGKVFLVREKNTGKIYAMKVLNKTNIIKRNQVEHTKTERSVLGYIKHPFIVGLNMAFQTRDKLYFVLDYCAGGELFFHLGKLGRFPETRASFYSAEIALALEHIHKLDIIYRDLKPENVLLDARGHVRLTDFGLSKEGISSNNEGAHSFCGTPEYLAPEILDRSGHGRAVDWWSLGALLYEMLTGLPPFYCRERDKLFEKIRSADLTFPKFISAQARSVLTGLLTRDPRQRLGSGPTDAEEVENHPFFSEINFKLLMKGAVPPPWEPTVCGSLDTSLFDQEFTSMPIMSPEGKGLHQFGVSQSDDQTFAGFTFTDDSMGMMHAGMQQMRGIGSH